MAHRLLASRRQIPRAMAPRLQHRLAYTRSHPAFVNRALGANGTQITRLAQADSTSDGSSPPTSPRLHEEPSSIREQGPRRKWHTDYSPRAGRFHERWLLASNIASPTRGAIQHS